MCEFCTKGEDYNHSEGLEHEICIECNDATGNAGKGEGSHYLDEDQEDGPYCWECFEELSEEQKDD